MASDAGRPYLYLGAAHTKAKGSSKEDLARSIAKRDGITEGLICVLGTVEPCSSFDVNKNASTYRLEVVGRRRKCLYLYFYRIDAELGFCHVRVQNWFPFEIQVWVNGREALSRALDKAGIGHTRYSSSIVACEDWEAAQALADKLTKRRWPALLNALARKHNPLINRIGRPASVATGGSLIKSRSPLMSPSPAVTASKRSSLACSPTPRPISPPPTCCASWVASPTRT